MVKHFRSDMHTTLASYLWKVAHSLLYFFLLPIKIITEIRPSTYTINVVQIDYVFHNFFHHYASWDHPCTSRLYLQKIIHINYSCRLIDAHVRNREKTIISYFNRIKWVCYLWHLQNVRRNNYFFFIVRRIKASVVNLMSKTHSVLCIL